MKISPGIISPATARALTDLLTKVERMVESRPDNSPSMESAVRGGVTIQYPRTVPRLVAKITGHEYSAGNYSYSYAADDCRYSWVEWDVGPNSCGGRELPGGRRGWVDRFPAVEIGGQDDVEEGLIVEMWMGPDNLHWRFNPGGGGALDGSDGTGGSGGGCISGPYEIMTISQQVCCNSSLGFSAVPWYVVFSNGGMHFFEDRNEARCYHIAIGRDGTFLGECS
jgi:hypothetical protein